MSNKYLEAFSNIGPYWSNSNAKFEASKPNMLDRVGRAVNPMTSLGSALGSVHDAASQGSVSGMALGALGALPMMAATKAGNSALGLAFKNAGDAYVPAIPNMYHTLRNFGAGALAAVSPNVSLSQTPQARYNTAAVIR